VLGDWARKETNDLNLAGIVNIGEVAWLAVWLCALKDKFGE
jgi:hypothetical protein